MPIREQPGPEADLYDQDYPDPAVLDTRCSLSAWRG